MRMDAVNNGTGQRNESWAIEAAKQGQSAGLALLYEIHKR